MFLNALGLISTNFKPSIVQKYSRIKTCIILALKTCSYGTENCTTKGQGKTRIAAAEM
jgi:hypothetical protein